MFSSAHGNDGPDGPSVKPPAGSGREGVKCLWSDQDPTAVISGSLWRPRRVRVKKGSLEVKEETWQKLPFFKKGALSY